MEIVLPSHIPHEGHCDEEPMIWLLKRAVEIHSDHLLWTKGCDLSWMVFNTKVVQWFRANEEAHTWFINGVIDAAKESMRW